MGATSLLKLVPANAADTTVNPMTKTRMTRLLGEISPGFTIADFFAERNGAAQEQLALTQLFKLPPRVELRNQGPMILQGAAAAQRHSRREFAVLDGKIAVQDFEFADLLEGRKLPVHVLDGAFHDRLSGGGIARDSNQRGDVRQAVADQQHVIDERL